MPDYSHGYSMPCSFPQYPPPPYTIGRVVGMNYIGVTTDEIARSLVPSPLVPNARQQLWIYS
ncbi:MAG: hypothetical protein KDB23_34300, partial [Planctomycetales bacterium]|nr:hypothetical protein [Planctomycetales bacterium]